MRGGSVWRTERRLESDPSSFAVSPGGNRSSEDDDDDDDVESRSRATRGSISQFATAAKGAGKARFPPNADSDSDEDEIPGAYAVSRVSETAPPINDVWDPTERMHDSPLFVDEPQSDDVLQTEPDSIEESEIPHVSCDLIEAPDIKPRRSRRWLILILFALIAIGAIGGVIGYLLMRKKGTSGSSATSTSDDDDDEDCQSTQDPFRQCECFGQIQVTDTSISDEYYSLTTSSELNEFVGLGISIESCSPENLALVWLATEMAAANEASQAVIDKKVLDRLVMAHVFETLGGRDWTERAKWMSSSSVCDWFGISCDGDGNIVMLSLPKNQLQGSLDSRLGLLQNLTTLQLSENDITGSIPLDVWSLPSLGTLEMIVRQRLHVEFHTRSYFPSFREFTSQ